MIYMYIWPVASIEANISSFFGLGEPPLQVTAQAEHLERLLRHLEALPNSAVRDFGPWKPQDLGVGHGGP